MINPWVPLKIIIINVGIYIVCYKINVYPCYADTQIGKKCFWYMITNADGFQS